MKIQMKIFWMAVGLVFLWSAIGPKDRFTWWLEVAPILMALPFILGTARRFPLTTLLYYGIGIHSVILIIGSHYTYAEVPFFFKLAEIFGWQRNHYDRVGHLAQGFFPALVVREVLIRTSPLKPGKWLFFLVTCTCLAVSALYELVEWWVALATGEGAEAFLGTQGDVWDTQWDMFLALIGALTSQILFSRYHNKLINKLILKG